MTCLCANTELFIYKVYKDFKEEIGLKSSVLSNC